MNHAKRNPGIPKRPNPQKNAKVVLDDPISPQRGNSSRVVSGPRAADVAGRIYRELRDKNYFATMHSGENNYATAPPAPSSNQIQARR